ncbi:uncharacterized transporter [[Candida] railenensis]|uniref:Uncharacterized transporter n=1 Tax=[Candida] railenensis TaxID=45579 RepID=A0A9P0QRW6_9ASCO|nr:uncharacterized transporter [[Candida] railenensis]
MASTIQEKEAATFQDDVVSASSLGSSESNTIVVSVDNGKFETVVKNWTDEEEKRVDRKIDFLVMPLLMFAFFILQVDRGNISNALTSTLKEDIGLDINKVNAGTALFNVGIVLFEIPSNILLQKFGAAKWLSFQIVVWSLCATLQSLITNYRSFLATRFLMGMLESGYIPGGLYYISTWYTRKQLTSRYTYYFVGNLSAIASSSLIAAGILKNVAGNSGLAGWKWIFIIEGVMGIGYGLIFAALLPNSPTDPRPFWKGFRMFTERESQIIRGKVLLDDPEKLNGSENISWSDIKETISQWRVWMHFLFTLSYMQSGQALGTYVPTIVKSLGYSSVAANAMTSIGYWCAVVVMIILTLICNYSKLRSPSIIFLVIWQLATNIGLYSVAKTSKSNAKFGLLVLSCISSVIGHVLNLGWASSNVKTPVHRSITMAMIVMAANMAGICGGQILRTNDSPNYVHAFLALMIVSIFTLCLAVFMTVQYIYSNKQLDLKYPNLAIQAESDHETQIEKVYNNRIVIIGKNTENSNVKSILSGVNTNGYSIEYEKARSIVGDEQFRFKL